MRSEGTNTTTNTGRAEGGVRGHDTVFRCGGGAHGDFDPRWGGAWIACTTRCACVFSEHVHFTSFRY